MLLLLLAGTALCQNAKEESIDCQIYRKSTIEESWGTIQLKDADIVIIEVLGGLAQVGLLVVCCTYIFIKESRESPGEIFMFLSFFNFFKISSEMAISIFVQWHRSFPNPPPIWLNLCFWAGMVNIVGRVGVNVYNILFCLYIWISIKNTLRPGAKRFYPYHAICLAVILVSAVAFYLTDTVGVSISGTCSFKMNPVTPYLSLSSFAFYVFIGCATLRSFKRHVPQVRILALHRREFVLFFNFYLIVNSVMTALLSFTVISFGSICIAHGTIKPGLFATLINAIQILEGLMVVMVRLRHPLIKSHLVQLYDSILGRPASAHNYFFGLTESIRLYHIYNFLSAVRIVYRQAEALPLLPCVHHAVRLDDATMRGLLANHALYQDFDMPPLKVTFFCASFFKRVHSKEEDDPYLSLAIEQNTKALDICSITDGGQSGEFFFVSQDLRFILKTIQKDEVDVFLDRASAFACHFEERVPHSLIVKFRGIFSIRYSMVDNEINLVLMPNLKKISAQVLRTWDLKGSRYKRQVLESFDPEQISKRTLKDTDFLNYEGRVHISPQLAERVRSTLKADVRFLASLGLMDYSLLLLKVQTPHPPTIDHNELTVLASTIQPNTYYILGIIDYLQLWNLQKQGELKAKQIITTIPGHDISAQEPEFYRDRFIANVVQAFFLI